jgi:hypothetical protein
MDPGLNQAPSVKPNTPSPFPVYLHTEIPGGAQILVHRHTKACTRSHCPTSKADHQLQLHGRSAESRAFFALAVIAPATARGRHVFFCDVFGLPSLRKTIEKQIFGLKFVVGS